MRRQKPRSADVQKSLIVAARAAELGVRTGDGHRHGKRAEVVVDVAVLHALALAVRRRAVVAAAAVVRPEREPGHGRVVEVELAHIVENAAAAAAVLEALGEGRVVRNR